MTEKHNQILSETKISRILDRMSVEILENNYEEKNLVLIGINGQGEVMAGIIKEKLASYASHLSVDSISLTIDKSKPSFDGIDLQGDSGNLEGKVLIVVDDVLNTGRTQAYSVSHLMRFSPKKVETAILVNRSHTSFPIAVTYSGIALSTTIDNHIEVKLKEEIGAYLY